MRQFGRAAALGALLLGTCVFAGADPLLKNEAPKSAKLTHASLRRMVEKLGHEPRLWGKDNTNCELTVTVGGVKAVFSVYLSTDETRLYLHANSRKLTDVKAVPPLVLARLLAHNARIGPLRFTLGEKAGRVYLLGSFANAGEITPAFLQEMIDLMADTIRTTLPDWELTVLQPAAVPVDDATTAAARKPLLGEWTIQSLTVKGVTTPAESFVGTTYLFDGTRVVQKSAAKVKTFQAALGRSGEIDFRISLDQAEKGIYKLDGDTLTLCLAHAGKDRPTTFQSPVGASCYVLVLKRTNSK